MKLKAAVVAVALVLTACSRPAGPVDPNVAACQAWHSAYVALTDSLAAYSGSGADPTVDAAIKGEQSVIADQLPKTTGDIHDTLALLQQAYASSAGTDGTDLGTAEAAMQVACTNLRVR